MKWSLQRRGAGGAQDSTTHGVAPGRRSATEKLQLKRKKKPNADSQPPAKQEHLGQTAPVTNAMDVVSRAEAEFHSMIGVPDHVSPHHFPFDVFTGKPVPIASAMDRLPEPMRTLEFYQIASIADADHGSATSRTELKRGELQEAMSAWQFSQEYPLTSGSIASGGRGIDFRGEDVDGMEVLFDPFMSPMSGPGREPSEKDQLRWSAKDKDAAYYKHTHGKGNNEKTIGVWDQTYTSSGMKASLKRKLADAFADVDAKVHELEVPLPRMYADEHVRAETHINEEQQARMYYTELAQELAASQDTMPVEQRVTLGEVLVEHDEPGRPTKRARIWRDRLHENPYWRERGPRF